MRQTLHVVGHVGSEIDDGGAEPGLGLQALVGESRFDEVGEDIGVDLLEPHHRARLVERPPRLEHALHQRRLGTGENVADAALILDGGAKRVFDVAAVERGDRLELVERDGQPLLAGGGDPAGSANTSPASRAVRGPCAPPERRP